MLFFFCNSSIINSLSPLELFGSIVAALGHDVGHPALNNKFLINSRDEMAMTYNDRSVLENMHSAKTFEIMSKEGCNILEYFSDDEWTAFRRIVLSMILETDMAKHFESLGKFRTRITTLGDINLQKPEDKEYVMNMAIKCADIGHAAKVSELHKKWTAFVCEEFFHQGDLEKERKLPVSMYCDRYNTNIPKSQAGFIKNICLPLYETWVNYLKSEAIYKDCYEQLKINLKDWEEKESITNFAELY